MSLKSHIIRIPEGFSFGLFRNKKYGISKQIYNEGKSFKIFGKDLEGNDYISLNYYCTQKQEILKPCEMPADKVIQFLNEIKILKQ